ncbi:MAG: type II secretion system F family protein [Phycisphaerales bacterium]|nr:MAG: type II secretion system F family protein [Phycisphaerales bacterium]
MATYAFEAMNQTGQAVKDEIEAASTEDALAKIRNLGYFPTRIREKGGGKAKTTTKKKSAGFAIGRVGFKQLTQFTRQFSTLIDAGLPILRSLNILEEQQKPGAMKNILRSVAEDIEGGATLSEAMAKHPKAFNRLYVNMVAAGETGGVLDTILNRLADFMEKAAKLKRKIIGALIYPVVVVLFAVGIVSGIMIIVIPKFKEIFEDFDTKLPKITTFLLGVSDWFVKGKPLPGWLVILGTPIVVFLFFKAVRQSKGGRYVTDVVLLRLPIFGNLVSKSAVARFTRTLGTLITAGVPILEAIIITKETSGNEVFARALQAVHDSIREGESFANPLRAAKVVDGLVVNMIDVGEETGELDAMLMKVADNYDEEVDTLVAGLVSLLEPIMVLFLGGMVGFIVLSLFMPMIALMESVS